MTTDLEKQFFDTFGIEKTCPIMNEVGWCGHDCSLCGAYKYPTITDRILLELICILSVALKPAFVFPKRKTIEEMKKWILQACIIQKEGIYTRVRTLFEEGE